MNTLTTISPVDGRYQKDVVELSKYFSEMALMRYRLIVEIEYLIALSLEKNIEEIDPFTQAEQIELRSYYKNFSVHDAKKIKETESVTNHDVKAIEYFLKEKIKNTQLEKYSEFIHFALTSEDVNNLSYTLMLKFGVEKVIIPELKKLLLELQILINDNKTTPLLSLTHGQPATPTTLGKELAVFYSRIFYGLNQLKKIVLKGKLNGATGNYAAMHIAYPEVDWTNFSSKFVSSLGLKPNLLTTQIESHDCSAEIYDAISRINNVVKDLDQDMWLYISRGIFNQKKKDGEVGSSTMPHKINPIQFENSEGNIGIANSYFHHLSQKLSISRMQRDLTDSTVLRNQGMPLAHSLLAYKNTIKGLSRLSVNKNKINEELENHWEVLAEAIQTIMRKVGYYKPYEKLKELTRGEKIDKEALHKFINSLDIPNEEKQKLLNLTPQTYTGLSDKLVELINQ